ncbi:hypothetical protein KC315_g38 [Hortaea werneckii]|nr:hypothetical protein KC315_g38 [Hortaea werneckii]
MASSIRSLAKDVNPAMVAGTAGQLSARSFFPTWSSGVDLRRGSQARCFGRSFHRLSEPVQAFAPAMSRVALSALLGKLASAKAFAYSLLKLAFAIFASSSSLRSCEKPASSTAFLALRPPVSRDSSLICASRRERAPCPLQSLSATSLVESGGLMSLRTGSQTARAQIRLISLNALHTAAITMYCVGGENAAALSRHAKFTRTKVESNLRQQYGMRTASSSQSIIYALRSASMPNMLLQERSIERRRKYDLPWTTLPKPRKLKQRRHRH